MRKLGVMFAATMFALAAVRAESPVAAQYEAPANEQKPLVCEWQLSGETLADFRADVLRSRDFDRSSPESTVRGFLAVAGGQLGSEESVQAIDAHIGRIVANELDPLLDAVVGDGLTRGTLSAAVPSDMVSIQEWKMRRGMGTPNDVEIVVYQPGHTLGDITLPGQEEIEPIEAGYCFNCRKGGDAVQWFISGISRYGTYEFVAGKDPLRGIVFKSWHRYEPDFVRSPLLAEPEATLDAQPEPMLQTKDEALQFFFRDVVERGLRLRAALLKQVFGAWYRTVKLFLHREWLYTLIAAQADIEEQTPPTVEYEIIEYRTEPTSILVRKADYYSTQWLFEFAESDNGWKIVGLKRRFVATRVRDGAEVETQRKVENIWATATEDLPTAANWPIFLPG